MTTTTAPKYPRSKYWAKKLGPVHQVSATGRGWLCNTSAVMLGNNYAHVREDAPMCQECQAAQEAINAELGIIPQPSKCITFNGKKYSILEAREVMKRHDEAIGQALKLVRALADQYTGRDPLALQDTDAGQWAEEIAAALDAREAQEVD
jgi:hypothetical protein